MRDASEIVASEATGTEITRFNALRHGVLSRYTVLPWEDEGEYRSLVAALMHEHAPQGPTEEHLVEEVAGVLWRKRRLRLAEAAAYRRGLDRTLSPFSETVSAALVHIGTSGQSERVIDAVRETAVETEEDIAVTEAAEGMAQSALELLDSRSNDAYAAALAALHADTREWWMDVLAGESDELDVGGQPATEDAEGLRGFLEAKVLPWFETRKLQLANRPLIREQAFGEALDTGKLERLGRYEVHLDRKLERMLAMLLRLKDLRQGTATA